MRAVRISVAFLILLLITTLAAGASATALPPPNTAPLSINGFGLDMARQIFGQESAKNVVISPYSISSALLMTYNGAGGSTEQAMAKVLRLSPLDLEALNQQQADLMRTLETADDKVTLNIANSLWGRKDIEFNPKFIDRNKSFFDAEVASLDFKNPNAPKKINDWVKRNTNNKIDKIVDSIPPEAILYLINAVYFYGTWQDEFEEKFTRDRDFFGLDGTAKKHPLMYQDGEYRYYENDEFQAVELPYGEGAFGMYVFLPRETDGLLDLQKKMTLENWNGWMTGFRSMEGDVVLPKFKIEYENKLNDELQAMGMAVAFDKVKANFRDMVVNLNPAFNLYISAVKHKTFIEVNEKGTEAAAVTSVEIGMTSAMPPQDRFSMVVDHPFLFAIRHNPTGTILFLGSIVEPK